MGTRVFSPTPLRASTGDLLQADVDGNTVGETLRLLVATRPGPRGHLCDGIRTPSNGNRTPGPGDAINIVPAIAGGSGG